MSVARRERGNAPPPAATGRRNLFIALGVVAVGVALWLGSGPKPSMLQGQLRGTVLPKEPGGQVTEADVRAIADYVSAALAEMGFTRRDVSPLPNSQIRIIIAESQAARIPEIRKRLEDPKYRVKLE